MRWIWRRVVPRGPDTINDALEVLAQEQREREKVLRESRAFGLWYWFVPVRFDLDDVQSAPEEDWELIKVWPADFSWMDIDTAISFIQWRHRGGEVERRCPSIVGVGKGDRFELAWFC